MTAPSSEWDVWKTLNHTSSMHNILNKLVAYGLIKKSPDKIPHYSYYHHRYNCLAELELDRGHSIWLFENVGVESEPDLSMIKPSRKTGKIVEQDYWDSSISPLLKSISKLPGMEEIRAEMGNDISDFWINLGKSIKPIEYIIKLNSKKYYSQCLMEHFKYYPEITEGLERTKEKEKEVVSYLSCHAKDVWENSVRLNQAVSTPNKKQLHDDLKASIGKIPTKKKRDCLNQIEDFCIDIAELFIKIKKLEANVRHGFPVTGICDMCKDKPEIMH